MWFVALLALKIGNITYFFTDSKACIFIDIAEALKVIRRQLYAHGECKLSTTLQYHMLTFIYVLCK